MLIVLATVIVIMCIVKGMNFILDTAQEAGMGVSLFVRTIIMIFSLWIVVSLIMSIAQRA